jgi:putative membrane protein
MESGLLFADEQAKSIHKKYSITEKQTDFKTIGLNYNIMRFIIEILLTGLAVFLGAKYIAPGVSVDSFGTALLAAILIALANATIGFILRILTFPLNFLTFGLVSFIISVLMILLVSRWLTGFAVDGFLNAAIFAIIVALIKAIFESIAGTEKN